MITIKEENNEAIIYADEIEPGAEGSIRALCKSPMSKGSRIRIMPDVHPGKGCVIGTTMTITDKIAPSLVGVDIGCGISATKLDAKRIDFQKLDKVIREKIPHGTKIRQSPHRFAGQTNLKLLHCAKHVRIDKALHSIGTLGGGNHFLEIDVDAEGSYWLLVHTGSRCLGTDVAEWYQSQAFYDPDKDIPYEFGYLDNTCNWMNLYLYDMRITQEFASMNRRAIIDEILKGMKWNALDSITSVHNYIDQDMMILRKGAVSARVGERLIIPLNMRDGCLICVGRGNAEWNYSAPHGAGRLMGRKEARESLTLSQYKKEMEGIYSTSISRKTLDESPMTYKPMEAIYSQIDDTATVIERIKPVYNFKSGE